MLSSIDNKPPAVIVPAPQAPATGNFQQDFNAFASPAVRAWVDAETTALLSGPFDLKRLQRDAASRGAGSSDPATAALVLRLAVEYRLQTAFAQRRSLATSTPAPPPSKVSQLQAMQSQSQSTPSGKSQQMMAMQSAQQGSQSQGGQVTTAGSSQAQLMAATQGMQEMQMSFNMQYLQLQDSMQNDNRQYTMVSNIMATKHDTVRNTISNIH